MAKHLFSNWAGNVRFEHEAIHYPKSEAEIVELVKEAGKAGKRIRLMGATHSWSALIECPDWLVSLDKYKQILNIDKEKLQVTVKAGIRLKDLNLLLRKEGLALTNLGTIAEQSIAGAIATGTHGSGINYGNISTQIIGCRLLTANGDVLNINEKENANLLPAVRVSLGALGIISTVTVQCVKAFNLREESYPVSIEKALELIESENASVDHFKFWWFPHGKKAQLYRWFRTKEALKPKAKWLKKLEDEFLPSSFFAGLLRLGSRFPKMIPSINRFAASLHFKKINRVEVSYDIFAMTVPPKHRECEYAIPLEYAKEAMTAYLEMLREKGFLVNFIVEVRFVKGDDIWLSPAYGRDTCYIAAYNQSEYRWEEFVIAFEELMAKYQGRPHWGKEFFISPEKLKQLYPKWDDFIKLMRELDPNGMFQNKLLQKIF